MRKTALHIISTCIAAVIVLTFFCSCGKKVAFSPEDFSAHENTLKTVYSFDLGESSENVEFDVQKLSQLENFLANSQVDYGFDELFNYEEAMKGVLVDTSVEKHQFSILDENDTLTKESLFRRVRKNNEAYLKNQTSIIRNIEDDDFLLRICEIIVDTINTTLKKYPEIDKERVYCNLGNLKIIEKTSALDFAAVSPEMVMHINRHTSQMANVFTNSNMYNVLVHESMHIIQFGCTCENIDNCIRRCGLAYAYDNRKQDYSDWTWLAEGSAERMASLYANVEPMTYTSYVNYLLSLDLVTVLKKDVPANYAETIYFYSDADKLFALFDAETEEEKQEIYKMIYSLEIMQIEPIDVKEAYKEIYRTEWTAEIRDDVNNLVKRPIVKTFTKTFYRNLINALAENEVSKNDVLFLINLYESTINYHLRMDSDKYDDYNAEFVKWYSQVQKMFFESLNNVSYDEYKNYAASDGESRINAGMKWLESDKKDFLVEKFEDNLCDFKFVQVV